MDGIARADQWRKEMNKDLAEAAMPLWEFLNKHYRTPHTYAIVTDEVVEIVIGDRGALFPVRDEDDE
jgi:hypothetical protein